MGSYHSIYFDHDLCRGRRSCLRACPTQAVRIRSGHAEMIDALCIDCGECLKVCEHHAIQALTHPLHRLNQFEYTVAIPSIALYTQLDAPPSAVFNALGRCGFSSAISVSRACDEAALAIELCVEEHRDRWPLLASDCPTVVRLVQARYPTLIDKLIPLLPPRELAAQEARERAMADTALPAERIGVVYITPCPSKMVSIVDHPGMSRSEIDAAVSIADVFPVLVSAMKHVDRVELADSPETASGIRWAWVGGRSSWLSVENSLSVAGLGNVIRILDDLEAGRLTNYAFISAMACVEGCVSGPLTVENPYVARARAIRLTRSLRDVPIDRAEVEEKYRSGRYFTDAVVEPRPTPPVAAELDEAILRMRQREVLLSELPGIDCGACGAPSCAAFADDVVSGGAVRFDCVFEREGRVEPKEGMPMTIDEIVTRLDGRLVAGQRRAGEPIRGGYASDLLSDVMAHAHEGDVWVTLQRHVNIVAVASVRDLAGIVLVGGREPEPAAMTRAEEEGVAIIVTPLPTFEVIGRLHEAGVRGRRD